MKENTKIQNLKVKVSKIYYLFYIKFIIFLSISFIETEKKNSKNSSKNIIQKKTINNSIAYNPIQEDYNNYEPIKSEQELNRIYNKKLVNDENNIINLRNKITLLENKTNRLQSMNELFLDLLKNQQRINKQHTKHNPDFINQFENRYNNLNNGPFYQDNYNKPKFRRSNSQLNSFDIKDIKYYKEPIKLMQEQLKAYIFQTTLDRRRQEYLINEQINDIKNDINNRLLKLEHQQKLQLSSIMNSVNNGSYNNFDSIVKRLMIQQRDRENLEEYMEEKLRNITNINNKYNKNLDHNIMEINNRYFNNEFNHINNRNNNNFYNYNNYFG